MLSSFQWKVILLVALITMINFIDRSAISFAIQPIEQEFGLTNAQFGYIAGAFGVGYILTIVFGGYIVDKFGTVGSWAISAALWSIATMLLSIGQGFWSFFWLRVLLGLAEGIHFPALVRTVADWLPQRWRGRATAIGLFGVPFASVIGSPLSSFLIAAFNWKIMFITLGGLGLLWVVVWLMLFRQKTHALFRRTVATSTSKTPWKKLINNRAFQMSCFLYFAFGYTVFFALMWLPGYLEQTHAVQSSQTGLLLLPPWTASSAFMLIGGWLSDYLLRRTRSLRLARSLLMGTSLLLSSVCFLCITFTEYLPLNILWMSLGLGLAFVLNPPIFSLNADMFGPNAGAAQGIAGLFFALAGIISPSLTGWVSQLTGNFHAAFHIVALLSLTSSVIVLLFQRPKSYI